jgi:hypothetical protein
MTKILGDIGRTAPYAGGSTGGMGNRNGFFMKKSLLSIAFIGVSLLAQAQTAPPTNTPSASMTNAGFTAMDRGAHH